MVDVRQWMGIVLILGIVSTTSFFLGTSFQSGSHHSLDTEGSATHLMETNEFEARIQKIEEHLVELKEHAIQDKERDKSILSQGNKSAPLLQVTLVLR
jgi:hypothetical protein